MDLSIEHRLKRLSFTHAPVFLCSIDVIVRSPRDYEHILSTLIKGYVY